MSHTSIPPLKAGHDVRFEPIYEAYERAWGDYDKAGDPADETYYAGLIDAYYNVLVLFDAIEEPSSAAETENDTYCEIVFDGTDTNGDIWNRCTVHNRLVFGDAPVCEGYRAPEYVESAEARKVRQGIETGANWA